ncbi:MAG: cysteine peptidase family C39 domain-containing protein, partial [Anaerolineales bacterium]
MKKPSGIPAKRYKTPTVIQMEALECGAASLAIILGYHGRYVSLEEVRTRCNVNRDGVKAGNITRAARSYGLEARGFHKSLEKMVQMPLPSIIHWNFNHFLVLEGLDDNHVYLNDPAYGPRKVSWDELDAAYTGIALQFTPAADFEAGRSKPTLRGLLARRLRGSRPALVFILLVSLLLLVPGIAQAGIAGAYIDSILVGASGDLPGLVAVMALLGVGMLGLGWLQMRYLLRLETKFALKTSAEYFWHVLRLPMGFFTQRFAGDIGARVALNDEIAVLLSRDLAVTFISVLFIGFYGLVMLQFSVLLTVITVLIALVNLVVLRIISRRRKDANTRALQEQGKMTGMVMAGLFNIEPLKARGAEAMLFSQVAGYHAKAINAEGDFKRLSAILTALPPALMMLAGTVVIVAGSVLVMDDA